jgi:hypothetical protein
MPKGFFCEKHHQWYESGSGCKPCAANVMLKGARDDLLAKLNSGQPYTLMEGIEALIDAKLAVRAASQERDNANE